MIIRQNSTRSGSSRQNRWKMWNMKWEDFRQLQVLNELSLLQFDVQLINLSECHLRYSHSLPSCCESWSITRGTLRKVIFSIAKKISILLYGVDHKLCHNTITSLVNWFQFILLTGDWWVRSVRVFPGCSLNNYFTREVLTKLHFSSVWDVI